MQSAERMAILSAIILVVLSSAYAAFPYNAQWLNYADKRIIYQIDTSTVTNNTTDIYVTVSIDPTELQSYINKWASYCDPAGRYDWFWPTFTYASTANNGERMLKIVEYSNWQTFTVGSCGSVQIPTTYTVVLPSGVLDGGSNFSNYTHYVFAYFKYPYVDDFSDNPTELPPEEYNNYTGSTSIGYIVFDGSFKRGHTLYFPNTAPLRRRIDLTINLADPTPSILCMYSTEDDGDMIIAVVINDTRYTVAVDAHCVDLKDVLLASGLSGTVAISDIELYAARYIGFGGAWLYYWWLIPTDVYQQIVYSS